MSRKISSKQESNDKISLRLEVLKIMLDCYPGFPDGSSVRKNRSSCPRSSKKGDRGFIEGW